MSQTSFETARLWLRPMRAEDADDLHVTRGDPEAMRWWYAGESPSVEATRQETADMASWGTQWVFGRLGDDTVLGYAGFYGLGPGEGCGFGYLLRRDAWGNGFVAEASTALFDHAFNDIGIGHAELWIDPMNEQSIRVAEKLRAPFRGWALTGRVTRVHGVTRDEWLEGRSWPDTINVVPVLRVTDVTRAMERWIHGFAFRYGWHVGEPAHLGQVFARWTGGAAVRLAHGPARPTAISMQTGGDVDAIVDRAVMTGWKLVEAPSDQPWGTRDATVGDEDGNQVVLAGITR